MKKKIIILLVSIFIPLIFVSGQQKIDVDFKKFESTHDISLLPWGPYSKKYAGISHIPDIKKGLSFEVSVMPGYYRNKVLIPNVLFESGYFPWEISADMRKITYRYELEWKDKVFVDVTYSILDSASVLLSMKCVNKTSMPQNLALNAMAYLSYPEIYPQYQIKCPSNVKWISGIYYKALDFAKVRPSDNLVYDGWFKGEECNNNYIDGSAVGKGFGKEKNDKITYTVIVSKSQLKGAVCFRYRLPENTSLVFQCSGLINKIIQFQGTGKFELLTIPYETAKEGRQELTLTSEGGTGIELNGLFYGPEKEVIQTHILDAGKQFTPELDIDSENSNILLTYPDVSTNYGIAWNYSYSQVRELLNDELDIFFRKYVHEHVRKVITGNGLGHYTNVFLRPVELDPFSERTIYGFICSGNKQSVTQQLADFRNKTAEIEINNQPETAFDNILPEGEKYVFSQKMMRAAFLSNIVYPIYTQGNYIRHFTPGKWWNSLYTWDSGFEAIGLSEIDPLKALQCLNAYTTPAGSQSAFIHHGSPVPVQIYVFFDLWNRTQNKELLTYFYPRLKQYYEFLAGKIGSSTTQKHKSHILQTWDYFYNSGGWDDYPAQKEVHVKRQYSYVSPVVTTAQVIRVAKILRLTAETLNLNNDIKTFDKDIELFAQALQDHSWDKQAGYFSYVVHDTAGNPKGFFRHPDSGMNFNMGLDGAYPLFSGICTPTQEAELIDRIFSENRMWTPSGIGVVDQSAPYYKIDGYWNGSVWMPHQWFIWKTMLDLGRPELAYKIASKALDVWQKETDESYYTFEHFFAKSGRGAGWHQFSGLSSPVLVWFNAYYKLGTVSTGFEIWIDQQAFTNDMKSYEAFIRFDGATLKHKRSMLVCMNPSGKYEAFFNDSRVEVTSVIPGVLQITLPATNINGKLKIIEIKK